MCSQRLVANLSVQRMCCACTRRTMAASGLNVNNHVHAHAMRLSMEPLSVYKEKSSKSSWPSMGTSRQSNARLNAGSLR